MAFWVVVAVLVIPRASQVSEALQVEGEPIAGSEASRANALIRESFAEPIAAFFVVTIRAPVPIDSGVGRRMLERLIAAAESQPYITRTVSYLTTPDSTLISDDHRTTFFVAVVSVELAENATDSVPAFRDAIHSTVDAFQPNGSFDVHVTGGPALDFDVRIASREDAETAEKRTLPVSAVILILAFGALVAAALPLVMGVFAITCALALVQLASTFHSMSVFVLTIITMVGLATGIDYSLLIVTRFREELNRGRRAKDAAERTIATAGRAVVTSGLTVAVGFAALLITPITETRSVGIGGLFVVTSAVLLAVTLLPATLSFLGRLIDIPRWLARRLAWYHAPTGWERWARWLGHHPWRAILFGSIAVALITWPLAQIKFGLPRSRWFPTGTESAAGVDALQEIGSRGALQPVRVVLEAPAGERIVSSTYLRAVKRFSDSIGADPRVSQVRSVVNVLPNMSMIGYTMLYGNLERARERAPEFYAAYLSEDARRTLLDVFLADTASFTSSMDVVRRIRRVADADAAGLDSVNVAVGGFFASSVDLQDGLLGQFPLVIALILVTTALMLFVAFQSILVPLKAVIMNCLSVAGAFGITVLVFQDGFGAGIFGLDGPTEAVFAVVPVIVFAVVFGLSMDYEVFLLARIKEVFERSGRNDQATMEGLAATASVITSAAAIMMIVFGAFAFSRVLAAQLMGFSLAMAVLLDATLIRMVLVPSIMHIAGTWNWWPGVKAAPDGGRRELITTGESLQEPEGQRGEHPTPDSVP